MDLHDIKIIIIIIGLLIMLLYIYKCEDKRRDHFGTNLETNQETNQGTNLGTNQGTNTNLINNEALQNIASVYNSTAATFNDLVVTNNIDTKSITTDSIKPSKDFKVSVNSPLNLNSNLCVDWLCLDKNQLRDMRQTTVNNNPYPGSIALPYVYSPITSDYIIYDDIIAVKDIVYTRYGINIPDDPTFSTVGWNGYKLLDIGGSTDGSSGIAITVPIGMEVIWIRVLNDRWTTLKINGSTFLRYSCGFRNIIKLRPDGMDDVGVLHRWVPYPVTVAGTYQISGLYGNIVGAPDPQVWISGLAFSKNPNYHAMLSAVSYYWSSFNPIYNQGYTFSNVQWFAENYSDVVNSSTTDNGDNLAYFPKGAISKITVPLARTRYIGDKMLYILSIGRTNDNAWILNCIIKIKGIRIENFKRYNNAFSRYYNSKPFITYLGARIPSTSGGVTVFDYNTNNIDVEIDTSSSMIGDNIFFREIGTHSY